MTYSYTYINEVDASCPNCPKLKPYAVGLRAFLRGKGYITSRREPCPCDSRSHFRCPNASRDERFKKYGVEASIMYGPWTRIFSVLGHLGMSGSWRITPSQDTPPTRDRHEHLVLRITSGHTVTYRDPRRFGIFLLTESHRILEHPLLKDMGPEPLSNTFCATQLRERLCARKSPIKTVLLDQKVVAGIGNIYASEALYRAGISPERPADKLSDRECTTLVAGIRDVLWRHWIRGSSLRDHITVQGELGYFQHKFSVYGRAGQPCTTCTCDLIKTGGVRKITQAGRSTFFCASRQP